MSGAEGWTDDRVATLRRMWGEGKSATQIAQKLKGTTRNAVIGKLARLGLFRDTSRGNGCAKDTARKVAAARIKLSPHQVKAGPQKSPPRADQPLPPEPPKPAALVKIDDLHGIPGLPGSSCRFPFGSPGTEDFGFCGAGTEGDKPYCAPHCAVAFQPAVKRERKARELNFLGRIG